MNAMRHDEMIAVIQAHKEGKPIQFRLPGSYWTDSPGHLEHGPYFDFDQFQYRIKPDPRKPREWCIELVHVREILESEITNQQSAISQQTPGTKTSGACSLERAF